MKAGFRQSMSWLHTWCGLTCGWLLCAIFLTGTLSVFREPITRWMEAGPVPASSPTPSWWLGNGCTPPRCIGRRL